VWVVFFGVNNKMELAEHKQFSEGRIAQLKSKIEKIPELQNNNLCIFVTGSYGRLEASKYSDIDLFFLDTDERKLTSNIDIILLFTPKKTTHTHKWF
jgi:UTP:GlnB (protein PII) uridylyltransferase